MIVTLILAQINIMNDVTSHSPNTESVTAISIWMLTCISFVCFALLEYGCLLFYKHRIAVLNNREKLTKVDTIGLAISVFFFILFNIIFWNL